MGKESFVKRTLDDNEQILAIARITRWKFLDEVLLALVFSCVIVTCAVVFKILTITIVVGVLLFCVWFWKSSKDILYINFTILSVTTRKIVYRIGFIKTRGVDIPLRNVDNVQINFSFIGRIFNYGTLRIESRSEPIEVNWIYNPTRFKNLIDRASQGYVLQRKE